MPPDPSFGCTYAPNGLTARLPPEPPPFIDPSLWQTILDARTIPPISALPPGISAEQIVSPYLWYKIVIRYRWKSGIIQLPIAKKPATPTILQGITGGPMGDLLPKSLAPSPDPGPNTAPGLPPPGLTNGVTDAQPDSTMSAGPPFSPTYGGTGGPPTATLSNTTGGVAVRPSSKIIQTAAPCGQKIVTFTIVRQGMQVSLPDPTPASDNETLLSAETDLYSPQPLPDGQSFVWAAAGTYIYALTQPYWITDGLVCGTSPADNLVTDNTVYGSFNVDDDLI